MPYQIVYKNELYHYRRGGEIKGRRLYQNLDGSLTPLGRIHYGVGPARTTKSLTKNARSEMKKQKEKASAERISRIDSDTKSRAADYDSFYKTQADKRKEEEDSLKSVVNRNEENLAKARYNKDTSDRVWEKQVDREPLPDYKELSKADFDGHTVDESVKNTTEYKSGMSKSVVDRLVSGSSKKEADDAAKPKEGPKKDKNNKKIKQLDSHEYVKVESDEKNSPKDLKSMSTKEIIDFNNRYDAEKKYMDIMNQNSRYDAIRTLGGGVQDLSRNGGNLVNRFKNIAEINYKNGQRSVDLSHISDEEMNATINRLNLEKRYREAISTPMNTSGYEKAREVLGAIGDVALTITAVAGVAKAIKDLKRN